MKFFLKRNTWLFFLGFVFLIIIIPTIILASFAPADFYRSDSTVTLTSVVTQSGTSTIINRSDKNYFAPNKTAPEWNSFANNAPPYVTVNTCGDGICKDGCPEDCKTISFTGCGDGICNNSQVLTRYPAPGKWVDVYAEVCERHLNGWVYVPFVNIFINPSNYYYTTNCSQQLQKVLVPYGYETRGEVYKVTDPSTQTECKDDCAAPAGSGCGVCGYATDGTMCPNYCSNRGYNMINCSYHSAEIIDSYSGTVSDRSLTNNSTNNLAIKKYFTASEALASASLDTQTYTYQTSAGYDCDFTSSGATNFCAAGTYCPVTGGLKPGTSYTSWLVYSGNSSSDYYPANVQKTCEPGFFCKAGSYYPRICPKNTYSTGGAGICTACPAGTNSFPGAVNVSYCLPVPTTNDTACGPGETPINSPYDCPASTPVVDGRCTGIENAVNDPADCACGNGSCDNSETYLSCMPDCYGLDSVCGTTAKINGVWTTYKETKYTKSYNNSVLNKSDCQYMDPSATCGDGICSASEGYNSSLGRIVCKLDCHCGDGYCSSSYGETHSNCNADCKCGDGSCNNGEDRYSCIQDCHCGNGQCEMSYGENNINCSSDCRCGDNVCSAGEDSTCAHDCFACNYDHICDSGENTSCTDCGHVIKDPYSLEY